MSVDERTPAAVASVAIAQNEPPERLSWRARGVRLYLLFGRPGDSENAPSSAGRVGQRDSPGPVYWHLPRPIEGWLLHEVAVPVSISADGRKSEPEVSVTDLAPTLWAMRAEAQQQQQANDAQTAIHYTIIHLTDLLPPSGVASASATPPAKSDVRSQLYDLLEEFDKRQAHEPRGYFEQYESAGPGHPAQRGRLGVGVRASLIAGLSDDTVRVFATLIQSGALAADAGFTREGFSVALNRVAQWNASQDLVESVERLAQVQAELGESSRELTALRASGDAATKGQIWLSYALAAIGMLLSFITFVKPPVALLPGLFFFGLSCFAQSRYAQTQQRRWHQAGKVIFALAALASFAGVLLPVILSRSHIRLFG